MADLILYKWQFKEIEPGKRVKRRLNWHMTEDDARQRYGDAIEPQPGSREVRSGVLTPHSVEPMQHLFPKKSVSPEFEAYLAVRAKEKKP